MTIQIKKIEYFSPRNYILNNALDVYVTLDDDYCTEDFAYCVEVTTPQFLSTIMERDKITFLEPDYPSIVVSKLEDDIIRAAIESFINSENGVYWLKLYHLVLSLTLEEINEILNRKKQESIKSWAEIEAEELDD